MKQTDVIEIAEKCGAFRTTRYRMERTKSSVTMYPEQLQAFANAVLMKAAERCKNKQSSAFTTPWNEACEKFYGYIKAMAKEE